MSRPAPRPFVYTPPPSGPLPVLYEDAHLLVLNKPSGLLTVPGKPAAHADCLEARAQAVHPTARIVHRLDMDTSGVIILALTAGAHRHLGLQFEKRRTAKLYLARVQGVMAQDRGCVDAPLRCDWPNRPRQMVDPDLGRAARTRWRVLAREADATRVALRPVTGRSHQLRVHMQSLGHPILGDNLYADDAGFQAAHRLQLHAARLRLRHPEDGRWCRFEAPCPF